jgi:hypothetical protein
VANDSENKLARQRRYNKKHYHSNLVANMLRKAKQRARLAGLPFDLADWDISIPSSCPVLGIPLKSGSGHNMRASPNSPSLDRIDNSKGYVLGNIAVISLRANMLKADATVEELKAIVAYMERSV